MMDHPVKKMLKRDRISQNVDDSRVILWGIIAAIFIFSIVSVFVHRNPDAEIIKTVTQQGIALTK